MLTFGPDGLTGHSDHQTVSAWTREAVHRAGLPCTVLHAATTRDRSARWAALYERFPVFEPGYPVFAEPDAVVVELPLPLAVASRKVRALRAQHTQTSGIIDAIGIGDYTTRVAEECFVRGHPDR